MVQKSNHYHDMLMLQPTKLGCTQSAKITAIIPEGVFIHPSRRK